MYEEPLYDPPYGNKAEDLFAYNLVKYLNNRTELRKQVEVETICGWFTLGLVADCTLTRGGHKRVAFRCGDHDELEDEWEDVVVLGD